MDEESTSEPQPVDRVPVCGGDFVRSLVSVFCVVEDTVITYLSKTGISMLPRAPPDMKIPLAMPRLRDNILRQKICHLLLKYRWTVTLPWTRTRPHPTPPTMENHTRNLMVISAKLFRGKHLRKIFFVPFNRLQQFDLA